MPCGFAPSLETLEAHASELGRLRSEAVAEAEQLKVELASQQQLVASLETELRAKQATADLLERNVGRITDLGASLAALDQRMRRRQRRAPRRPSPRRNIADFVATLAADDRLAAAALQTRPRRGRAAADGPAARRRAVDDEVVDIGERTAIEAARKLVITIGGERSTTRSSGRS